MRAKLWMHLAVILPAIGCEPAGNARSVEPSDGERMALERSGVPFEGKRELLVLLDTSESMTMAQMEDARTLVRYLIEALQPEDRFALITFGDDAALEIEPGRAEPESKRAWRETLESLDTSGKTHLAAALDRARALSQLDEPRWLLLTDGFARWGDVSLEGLRRRTGGRPLCTVGVGARVNEELLRALAAAGGGSYFHLGARAESSQVARDVLAKCVLVSAKTNEALSSNAIDRSSSFAGGTGMGYAMAP